MKIQFIGATHEVTGSCTLLEVNRKYYLVDCGMEQGKDVFQNITLPVPASEIEAVFLTHAHIDHSGMLPRLYRDGFKGSIYATEATTNLCDIMLRDSAHIQEFEAQWRTRKAERAGEKAVEPVYDMQDAIKTIALFRPCNYGEIIYPAEGIQLRFTDIGHLLGSACIELWLKEGETERKIVFSGDVGNINQRIIKDPQQVEETDYLVIESTYGNRVHATDRSNVVKDLANYIQSTFDKGGNVVIPSFAIGRTQELLYALREIKQEKMVKGHDGFKVYLDSPLAQDATAIFMQCDPECFDEETKAVLKQGINPIWFDDIKITATAEESKAINFNNDPKVIISASGMCEAGRIRHHLKHNLWKKNNTILFVGYQAEGSLGRQLIEGVKKVTLFGEEITVRANIVSLKGSSGHADKDGLMKWIKGFNSKPKQIFVNHGENDACEDFKALLLDNGYRADAPFSGTEYDLITGNITVFTEGKYIDRERAFKGATRAEGVYKQMLDEAQKLLTLVKSRKGRTNKDNAKLTSQIRALYDKWKGE
ncbi:MAG: MBL fold metallo-hydrolase [Clostridiales bacterium]|nr:MBL fold metallo-hydrolase [Clostridiales bacterium]